MFSQEFGHNTSQTWLLSFGITTLIDIICTDVLIAFLGVLIVLYFPKLKYAFKKRKNQYKVSSVISNLAGDVAGAMDRNKSRRNSIAAERKKRSTVAPQENYLTVDRIRRSTVGP